METLLHLIQELQRLADDLAAEPSDTTRHQADAEEFFGRLEVFVTDNFPALEGFITTRLTEARANMGYLLRQKGDLERYQMLLKRGLDGVYQTVKNPPQQADAESEDASTSSYYL